MKTFLGAVASLACCILGLGGCAQIEVHMLKADGTIDKEKEVGFKYYPPRPYLQVVRLPVDPTPASKGPTADQQSQSDKVNPADTGSDKGQKQDTTQTQAATAPASDTSFAANTTQYYVKLIYLPDFDHPVSVTMTAGLFGTLSAQPTFQDGWMLTGLQASVDNSQLPQMVGTIISAAVGGAQKSTGGANKAAADVYKAPGGATNVTTPSEEDVLEPGLYAFVTKGPQSTTQAGSSYGSIVGLCLVQRYGPAEANKPRKNQAIPLCPK